MVHVYICFGCIVMWVYLQYINSLVRFKSGWAPFGLIQATPTAASVTVTGEVRAGRTLLFYNMYVCL